MFLRREEKKKKRGKNTRVLSNVLTGGHYNYSYSYSNCFLTSFNRRPWFLKMLFNYCNGFRSTSTLYATTARSSAYRTFFSSSCSDTFPLFRFIAIMKSRVLEALPCLKHSRLFRYVSLDFHQRCWFLMHCLYHCLFA